MDFSRGKNGPLRIQGNGPLRRENGPLRRGKRPINANGQFSGTPTWSKTAPLKRPIKRSMSVDAGQIMGSYANGGRI